MLQAARGGRRASAGRMSRSIRPVTSAPGFGALCLAAVASTAVYWLWRRRTAGRQKIARSWPSEGVATGPSRIPGAGDGLFATRTFEADETLCEYFGEVLSFAEMVKRADHDYIMGGFGPNRFVDASASVECPGRYVNDNFDSSKVNAAFRKDCERRRAQIIALRRIYAGEEVYCRYGEDFWLPRGIDPTTGGPHEPDEETRLGLRLLAAARARAMARDEAARKDEASSEQA